MKFERLEAIGEEEKCSDHSNPQKPAAKVVLQELFELLEDYGPVWFTKENRARALAALQERP